MSSKALWKRVVRVLHRKELEEWYEGETPWRLTISELRVRVLARFDHDTDAAADFRYWLSNRVSLGLSL